MNVHFRLTSLAVLTILTFGCERAPETASLPDPEVSEINGRETQTCEQACQRVVSCLRGGPGSYGGYGEGYGGYGEGYGGYGSMPGYGGYGDGYGGYGEGYGGYGEGYGGYGEACGGYGEGYGGYGEAYGGYGSMPGYGGAHGRGNGGTMLSQCIAGCRALPQPVKKHLVNCVMSSLTCKVQLACE